MLDYILLGFANLLEINLLILIVVALLGGMMIGVLPGFSPTMGVALLVPFTFTMTPVAGLTVLAGLYTGAVYGGSISAILLNIPGAPANIATLFDGYPMAQKGEAKKALYTSAIASSHGGLISAFLLIIFAPLLAVVALKFGPVEKFWISIFGLVIIAGLGSGKGMIKGLIAGAFGVWLGVIGISPTTGEPRFTFGLAELWGGVSLVPAMVGFFAFSQVLLYFEKIIFGSDNSPIPVPKNRLKVTDVFKEIWTKYSILTIYSGLLGSLIGIIPGAGGQIGGIIAYDHAKRISKNHSNFGRGQIEGVVAPETANNATVGGAIIPLLTLGIPGSPTAAVLIGGLLIHGLWPGPLLFTVNAEITYTFMAAFLLSQLILVFVAVLFLSWAANILKVREHYLGPLILALCIFGSFAVNNNFFDVYVMLMLGAIGYLFVKVNLPPAPVILGLILGPIAEENFLLGLRIGMAKEGVWNYFFTSTIAVIVIIAILVVIASTVWYEVKRKTYNESRSQDLYNQSDKKGVLSLDSLMGLFLLLSATFVWHYYLAELSMEVSVFPTALMLFIAIAGFAQFLYGVLVGSDNYPKFPWKLFLEVIIATLIAIYAAGFIGFYSVVFLLMLYIGLRMQYIGNLRRWNDRFKLAGFSIISMSLLYIFFKVILYLPTPRGLFI